MRNITDVTHFFQNEAPPKSKNTSLGNGKLRRKPNSQGDHFTSHSETILDSEIRSPEVGCLFASLPKLDMGMTE